MIKYSEELYSTDSKQFIFESPETGNLKSDNLDDLIKSLSSMKIKGNHIEHYFINIFKNNNASNEVYINDIIDDNKSYSVLEIKKLMSEIAINRFVIVSSSLDEIYSEEIEVKVDEFSTVTSYFDYGLLYGNKSFSEKDIVYTNYLNSEKNGIKFQIERLPNPIDMKIAGRNVSEGVYCMYNGTLLDKKNNEFQIIDTIDIPIPSSTFYKKL